MTTIRQLAVLFLVCVAGAACCADRAAAEAYLAGVPTLISGGDFKTIDDLCKRSLAADDTCPLAHFYMALCLDKTNKARDAFKEYQITATLATKERDAALTAKANAAAKRIGAGLMELDALDVKLAEKLQKIAEEAYEAGRFDTAHKAYTSLLVLQPANAKVKEALTKTDKALQEHANPVKTKIAAAMLAETWYNLGVGKKSEAVELAKSLAKKYAETEWGREAAELVERDFAAPKKDEVAQLAQKLKDENAKGTDAKTSATAVASATQTSPKPAAPLGKTDIEALEKAADDETKKLAKDALVAAFDDAHKNGKAFYAKATPGSEGNQENLAKALEMFVKAESLYARIEAEELKTDDLAESAREASMLRYACMKMTILTR